MSFVSTVGEQPTSAQYARAHRKQIRDSRGRFAGGWGVAWQGLSQLDDNVYEHVDDVLGAIHRGAEELKDQMVEYMKANAPWADRTGDAREGLQGAVVWQDDTHFTIMLGHGENIEYGIWLEVRWGGKYAIVTPTVHHFAPMMGATIVGAR